MRQNVRNITYSFSSNCQTAVIQKKRIIKFERLSDVCPALVRFSSKIGVVSKRIEVLSWF